MDLIVLDLDGSLLRSDKTISAYSCAVLRRMRECGHVLVFATARPPRAVAAVVPAEFRDEFVVCYNGAQVWRGGRLLLDQAIPASDVARVFSYLEVAAPRGTRGFEHADQLYVTGSFEHHFPAEFCTELDDDHGTLAASPKILVDLTDDFDVAAFMAALPASCYAIRTDGGGLCQIMPVGADKASGVAFVLRELGLGFDRVVCFGDDHNDLPLFRRAGCAVAMGNAIAELKAEARHVTASNDDDGVGRFLSGRYLTRVAQDFDCPVKSANSDY